MFMSRFSVFAVLALSTAILPAVVFAAGTTTVKTASTGTATTSKIIPAHTSTTPATTTTPTVAATTTPAVKTPETPATPAGVAALSATAQTRITNLAANISNREDATVRRIQNVTTRLESRLATMKAAGKDVLTAESKVTDAKTNLGLAKSSLNTIDKAVATFVGSSNPKESWNNLKSIYITINTNIKAAYEALKDAVTAAETAGDAVAATPTTATTTASTTTATTTKTKK